MSNEIHNDKIIEMHNDILNKLNSKLDVLQTNFIKFESKIESKIDNLEDKITKLTENRFNDTINIKDVIRHEVQSLEVKIDTNLEKIECRVGILENFRAEINGKIMGSILGVTVIFTLVTFLLNKFL